jgi:hypothetical protein
LMAPIDSETRGESFLKESAHAGQHNYVFLNTADESTHQLLPTHDYLITNAIRLPEERPPQHEPGVQWFLYFLIKDDTDGDKKLTYKDRRTLAVSDSGGWGYTEVIQEVEQVYGQTLRDPNTLLIVFKKASKRYLAKVDLPGRKLVSTKELAFPDAEVQ